MPKVIYTAKVLDSEDPLMLNRVRLTFDSNTDGINNSDILKSIPDTFNGKPTKENGELLPEFVWSQIDNFVFLPLIPLFLKVTPKKDESVNVIFPNNDYKFGEQYYIQGIFSSPTTMYLEDHNSQRLFALRNSGIKPSKNLKNNINKEYLESITKGVFPEPEDVAILGRGTCDIILKDNNVLLRSGKSKTLPNVKNQNIAFNNTRSFLQLSNFFDRVKIEDIRPKIRLEQNVQYVKTLIEWYVGRPENQQDNFDLDVYIYRLPDSTAYTTNRLFNETIVKKEDKALVKKLSFSQINSEKIVFYINKIISQVNKGKINIDEEPITKIENQHPIVFRVSELTYKWISENKSNNDLPQYKNLTNIADKIKFLSEGKEGYGLIFSKNLPGQQTTPRTIYEKIPKRDNIPTTYGILGADKLIFLSHESQIPSGQRILLDQKTALGIEQEFLAENVIPNTNSMVRGEELIKFMNLVVSFLISHVHAFPGLPPIKKSTDGVTITDILSQLQNANNTILNQNMRIN